MPQAAVKVNRLLPSAVTEGNQTPLRGGRYAEAFTIPMGFGAYPLVQEGTYFKAINATPGTGIAQTIQTTFLSTNGVFMILNGDAASGKHLVMDYIRLINTVVGTTTTRSEAVLAVDNTNRFSAGGSTLTAVNANMDVATSSIATVRFGALTLTAESGSVRRLSRFQLRTAIMVQFEEFIISFGRPTLGGFNTLSGTNGQRMMVDAGPVVIGPGNHSLIVHLWNPGNATTAPSWEVEAGWWER